MNVLIYTWNIAVDMIIKKYLLANMTKANIRTKNLRLSPHQKQLSLFHFVIFYCHHLCRSLFAMYMRFNLWSCEECVCVCVMLWNWHYWEWRQQQNIDKGNIFLFYCFFCVFFQYFYYNLNESRVADRRWFFS